MWFVTNNIDSQSIDWKSSLNSDVIYQTKMNIRLIDLKQTRLNLIQGFQDYAFFLPAKYAQFFGELCAQNPELCANYANCAIFLVKN